MLSLYQITSPYFVAGIEFDSSSVKTVSSSDQTCDYVSMAAPILFYMERDKWDFLKVARYCKKKNWKFDFVRNLD